MRRRAYGAVAVVILVSGGLAACSGGDRRPTRAEYITRVGEICQRYGRRLDKVRPPADIATPGEVADSVRAALPILKAQAREIRRIKPPRTLEATVDRFFVLTDRSIAGLEEALKGALARDIGLMGRGELHFLDARDEAKRLAGSLGFKC